MSRSRTSRPAAEDIWSKLDREPIAVEEETGLDTTVMFVGDSGSGKSSLIQSFLKPTVNKGPKSTFALEYSFARKKSSTGNAKCLAHIWELGGDIYEPGLLEVPLSQRCFASASIVVVVDLSKPHNVVSSTLKWVSVTREVCLNYPSGSVLLLFFPCA